ncbi:MAG: LptF/LptG family permease [Phycisphaerales bacterium]
MRITTPVTIWRFLVGQLLKLMLLTVAILVVVLSFVASVRMFANGTLGVVETLMLAGWLTVPMLQYALPFAGGFAATLAYHRMSQDNELTASYAGGISHKTLLLPTAALGLVMAIAMFAMADQVMPRFLRSAQEMVTADPSRLLAGRLGKGQSMELPGGKLLYADSVSEVDVREGERAFKHIVLRGVVALEVNTKGEIERELSSRLADVWLYHDAAEAGVAAGESVSSPAERWAVSSEGGTTAVMELRDPVGGKTNYALATVDRTQVVYKLPSTFRDKPKFLSWTELNSAWVNPQRVTVVEEQRRALAEEMAERTVVDTLRDELRKTGRLTLLDAANRPVIIRAGGIAPTPNDKGTGFALAAPKGSKTIEVTVVETGGSESTGATPRTRVHRAERAFIGQLSSAGESGTSLTLAMEEVATTGGATSAGGDDEAAGVLSALAIAGLKPSSDPLAGFMALTSDDLIAQSSNRLKNGTPDVPLARASKRLNDQVNGTRREIRSKQHERVATSISCFTMVLLGAVMGMRLGRASPLMVYLWSFMPALLGELAISGGQTMVSQQGAAGLPLLYGGVGLVALFTLVEFRLLARH